MVVVSFLIALSGHAKNVFAIQIDLFPCNHIGSFCQQRLEQLAVSSQELLVKCRSHHIPGHLRTFPEEFGHPLKAGLLGLSIQIIVNRFDQRDLLARDKRVILPHNVFGFSDPASDQFDFRTAIEHMCIIIICPFFLVTKDRIGFIDPKHSFLGSLSFFQRHHILMVFFNEGPPSCLHFLKQRIFRNTENLVIVDPVNHIPDFQREHMVKSSRFPVKISRWPGSYNRCLLSGFQPSSPSSRRPLGDCRPALGVHAKKIIPRIHTMKSFLSNRLRFQEECYPPSSTSFPQFGTLT